MRSCAASSTPAIPKPPPLLHHLRDGSPAGIARRQGIPSSRFRGSVAGLLSFRSKLALPKRPSVQMPMKGAQVTVFKASAKRFWTERKRKLDLQPYGFGRLDGSSEDGPCGRPDLTRQAGELAPISPF